MAVQMPAEAVGPAAGIVVHSIISLFVGLILVWLVWVHDERKSYVMMLQSFICLHTLASIAQQIHTIVNWNDIKTDQWENIRQNVGNPELSITGASTGLDLPLFYIQYYCYNVEAMIIVCWAVELANSIFQVRVVKIYGRQFSMAAKITCVVLPIITMLLLRFSPIQNSTPAFLFVSSGIMVLCFLIGAIVLFCILFKYIYSRFALTAWDVRYGRHTEGSGTGTGNGSYRRPSLAKPRTIYDRWLVTRFSIAFVALGLFELVIVNFQLRASNTNTPDNIPPFADLSAGRAVSDFVLYIPGATAGPLTFLIFGTTRTFREYMWKAFAPKWLQRKREARRDAKRHRNKPSVVIADPNFVAAAENGNIKPLPPLPRNDEEAQYDYGEDGVKMQDLGVSAWIEGGAKAGATGMGPEAISATSSAPASPPPPPPPAVTRTHLHPNAGLGRKALGDDLSNKSETDDDFPIMKHSSRNSSRSVMIFMDRDSDVDLEAQKEVDQAGSSNFKTTRWQ